MAPRTSVLAGCLFALAISGCHSASNVTGGVLHPGESIEARNRFGSVRVAYAAPLKRRYSWDSHSRVVTMIARPEPWLGEQGLYDPANCFVLVIPLCQTPRLVVAEATHDFATYEELYAFLYQGGAVMDWVYTSDGLLVGFGRQPLRQQINVDVRQLTIQGRKPQALKGARDRDIRLARTLKNSL